MSKIFAIALLALVSLVQSSSGKTESRQCPDSNALGRFKSEIETIAERENVEFKFILENLNQENEILLAVVRGEKIIFITCSRNPPNKAGLNSLIWREISQNLLNSFQGWKGRAFWLYSIKRDDML